MSVGIWWYSDVTHVFESKKLVDTILVIPTIQVCKMLFEWCLAALSRGILLGAQFAVEHRTAGCLSCEPGI